MRPKGQTEQGGNEKKREVGKRKIDGRSNMKSRIKRDTDGKEQRVVRDELQRSLRMAYQRWRCSRWRCS